MKNGALIYAASSLLSPFLILSNRVVAVLKSSSASDSLPRCCSCNRSGRCLRCACVQGRRNCDNCAPSYHNRCSNQPRNSCGSQTMMSKNHSPPPSEVILVATEANSTSSPTDVVGPPDAFAHSAIVTPVQTPIASPIVEPSAPLSPPELPLYPLLSQPAFTWGQLDGQDFTQAISAAYAKVVHWRCNLFLVPSGKAGRDFVTDINRQICMLRSKEYAQDL